MAIHILLRDRRGRGMVLRPKSRGRAKGATALVRSLSRGSPSRKPGPAAAEVEPPGGLREAMVLRPKSRGRAVVLRP